METYNDKTEKSVKLLHSLMNGEASVDQYVKIELRANRLIQDLFDSVFTKFNIVIERQESFISEHKIDVLRNLFESMSTEDKIGWIFPKIFYAAPEWIFPLGFNEVRYSYESISEAAVTIDEFLETDFESIYPGSMKSSVANKLRESFLKASKIEELSNLLNSLINVSYQGPQYRSEGGTWISNFDIIDSLTPDFSGSIPFSNIINEVTGNWIKQLKNTQNMPTESMLSMPSLWLPSSSKGESLLHKSAKNILNEVFRNKVKLRDLHWRSLEEIVAEILKDLGLSVAVTKRSWDGGRDVIACGEIIPGEPTVLAVEVKQMPVVPISALREALWANRHFPALLFATAGRFSAGIFREKSSTDNFLRLYLKDGLALGQWIDMYAQRRGWKKFTD